VQIFPKWTNQIPVVLIVGTVLAITGATWVVWYYFSPWHTDVGYSPKQPVAYSHKLHAGELGIDCLYCHGNAEKGAHANIPATQVCMNCHKSVKTDSAKLALIRESYEKSIPVEWVRIHKIPDYAFFNHSVHLHAGVGCVECHGRIDEMTQVRQEKPLSMSWCLDCHRNPEGHLRPPELVTAMNYTPSEEDRTLMQQKVPNLSPPVHCSGCHR